MAKPSPWTTLTSRKYTTVKNVSDILDLSNIPNNTVKQYIDDKSVNMGIFSMDGGTRKYIRGNEGETGMFLVDVSSMDVEQHETYLVSAEFYDIFSTYAITLFDSDNRNTLVDFCEVDDSQGYHYIDILVNEEASVLQIIKLSGSSNFIITDSLTGSLTDSLITQKIGIKNCIDISYSNLKSLKSSNKLIPGVQYCITDYQARTTQSGTSASTNDFNIIVTAESRDKLSETAKAIQRSDTTYFNNSKLEAWELKYCLDNDTNRFAWADSGNTGRGVIYYMKDEFNNEAPYDFKNIKFQRFPLSNPVVYIYDEDGGQYIIDEDQSLLEELSSNLRGYGTANTDTWVGLDYNYNLAKYEHRLKYSAGTDLYLYTFGGSVDKSLSATTVTAKNNVILPYIDSSRKQALNSIVIEANNISGNTFGNNCKFITIRNSCNNNEIGNECSDFDVASLYDNIIRKGCTNIYSNYFYKNIIGYNTSYLTFDTCGYSVVGLYCNHITIINSYSNTIGNLIEDVYMRSDSNGNYILNAKEEDCIYTIRIDGNDNIIDGGNLCYNITINGNWNKLGTDCRDITLNSGCNYNSFGINCSNITLGNNCTNNSFGNSCNGNTFGSDCSNNFLENGVNHFNFGATAGRSHHYHNVIVETGNQYIKLDCTSTLSGTVRYRNAKLLQGINNTSTYKTITDSNTGNQTYQTVYQPANSITINV